GSLLLVSACDESLTKKLERKGTPVAPVLRTSGAFEPHGDSDVDRGQACKRFLPLPVGVRRCAEELERRDHAIGDLYRMDACGLGAHESGRSTDSAREERIGSGV